jgi:pyridoxamine 5'-phosphate oxidase
MVIKRQLTALKHTYGRSTLTKASAPPNPLVLVEKWLEEAIKLTSDPQPNAMSLATCGNNGRPSNRMVLLKSIEDDQFHFYTNYQSQKGQQLFENPSAALCLYWGELERQIRIEGTVKQLSRTTSCDYFKTRTKESQLSALASGQSQPLANRAKLTERFEALAGQYQTSLPECPPHWGGYALVPTSIEFWQGRSHRLHDRLLYQKTDQGQWHLKRLCP